MKIQLLADPEYSAAFSAYLEKIEEIELTTEKPDLVFDVMFLNPQRKLSEISKLGGATSNIISNTLTVSITSVQQAAGLTAECIGMPIFPHYFERQKTIEFALPFGKEINKQQADSFLSLLGKDGEQIQDAIAGVFPRTLAMIVNEAAFAVQESVAVPEDIDVAMKLGTNYPKGPLAWCDEIGAKAIVAVLDALSEEYGADRYRVAPLLRRYAEAGMRFIPGET